MTAGRFVSEAVGAAAPGATTGTFAVALVGETEAGWLVDKAVFRAWEDRTFFVCSQTNATHVGWTVMHEEVSRVMEGGREAFERRYRRLGPEPTHVR